MIKIINLRKSFGDKKVLDGVNLEIERGKITVIIGRSGEGKSVLIKHIIGLLKPDEGAVFLEDQDLTSLRDRDFNEVRKRFGMLFQGAALFDSMTVAGNVGFPLKEHTDLNDEDIGAQTTAGILVEGVIAHVAVIVVIVQNQRAQTPLFHPRLSFCPPLFPHALGVIGALFIIYCILSVLHLSSTSFMFRNISLKLPRPYLFSG